MRSIGLRLPILALLVLAFGPARVRAVEVLYLETVDWVPTARVLTVPTSYVVASSYVVPTSYVIPTVYATSYLTETAFLTPTTYLEPTFYETRFQRRGLFGRRLVETTRAYYMPTTAYYPTTYYYPTTFYSPTVLERAVVPTEYVATSATVYCGEVVATTAPLVRSYPVERVPAVTSTAPRSSPRSRPSRVQSESAEEESISSNVEPAPELPQRETRPEASRATQNPAESPPAPPVPAREQTSAPRPGPASAAPKSATPAGGGTSTPGGPAAGGSAQPRTKPAATTPGQTDLPPLAPSEDGDLQPAPGADKRGPGSGTLQYETKKPVLSTPRTIRSAARNVLFGRVKSRDTDEPEEGVQVMISSRMNSFQDRVALSDAFGRFAVKVPDGDWTVKVTMPSGRVYSVSEITVSNGLITDDNGRDIPSLVITR